MEKRKIKDLCKAVSSNLQINKLENNIGDYPLYGASGLVKGLDFYKIDKPYVSIVKDGAGVGRISFHEGKSSIVGTMQAFLNNDDVDLKFFYYALKSQHLDSSKNGSTIPHIYFKNYGENEIYFYPIEIQRKISQHLGAIDASLESKKRQVILLDELIKSRFIEMFGDIVQKATLENLTLKITDGSHNPPKGVEKSGYLMLSSQNVYESLVLDDVRFLSKEEFERENKRTDIQNGDVLLTIVGTVGRTYVVKNNEKYVFQRSVGVIKPIPNLLNGTFLSVYLQTPEAINQLEAGAHGSSQKGIYLNDLKKLLIPAANYSEQLKFASFVEQVDKSKFVVHSKYFLWEFLTLFSSTMAYSSVVSILA